MSQVRVSCPSCQATLTLNHPWPSGMGARCPCCQYQFALSDPSQFAPPVSPIAPRPAKSQTAGGPCPTALEQVSGYSSGGRQQGAVNDNSKLAWIGLAAGGGLIGTVAVGLMILVIGFGSSPEPIEQSQPTAPAAATAASTFSGANPVPNSSHPYAPSSGDAQPATQQELEQLLADLASAQQDFFKKNKALESLKNRPPLDSQRARVTKTVEPLMRDTNALLRQSAIAVMGAWGTKETVPVLVKLLDQLDSRGRRAAIEVLGRIRDKSSADALAPLLANQSDQHNAARALVELGPIAEPAVIKMLPHSDKRVRFHACQTLGKIGGKASVAALKKLLLREQDGFAKLGAEGALRELGKRGL
jgi:HEAT repeat protein